ncbi:copper-binding protein [Halorubrum sp. SP3]|uniref:NosD domain-containing protein n=1 Tax=Halorubrum sp. SP3 TaxID=1537265 RepID=UPI0010F72107|nr:NosD domain-containing protein [Halorubrum sp. SP3]TKX55717.1 copper-binding protein [Halorubrum sp. SP3]
MAILDPYSDRSRAVLAWVAVFAAIGGLVVAGAFLSDPAANAPDPVAYDDTVELGLSTETDSLMSDSGRIPRVQVFYSQLQYVIGYNGVESFVDRLDDGDTERRFGYPLVAYVETFDGTEPGTTETGLFTAAESRPSSWTPAREAVYVVGSEARTPAGETVIPFASRDAATAFTGSHGGETVDWAELQTRSFDVDSGAVARAMAPERWEVADRRVTAAERTADRPVSVTVGADAETISAAVDAAPPNTTVVVPPGSYEERINVTKPLTIAGEGAHVSGGGNGSVITVRAPNVAVTGLTIDGTGNRTRDPEAARRRAEEAAQGSETESWDTNIQLGYGYGDAGIRGLNAPGLFIDDVAIDTNASGVLLRDGSDAVIRDIEVNGTGEWDDGFMGITGMESRVTVTNGTFTNGRDGIYLHRADGSIVRNSTFRRNRYGVHLMYTGDALIADNSFRDEIFAGITVMTRPARNAIVGNDVRGSAAGIQSSGTLTYIGYNTLAHNGLGFSTSSRGSLYEHNVVVDNEVGARATTVVPASRVVANDFVGNDHHAGAGAGPLRVWADGDCGNYWEGANAGLHEPGERAYRPTWPIDAALHREPAVAALRESPVNELLERLRGTVAGARSGSIIDPAPAPEPYAPDRVAAAADPNGTAVHADWRAQIDNRGHAARQLDDRPMTADDRNATRPNWGTEPNERAAVEEASP